MGSLASAGLDPEEATYDRELGEVLEKAIRKLPAEYRLIFTLRDVEGMTTDETAECLALTPENVTVRQHRARVRGCARSFLHERAQLLPSLSEFHATRSDRVVKNVFRMLGSKD